jgi:hypothetical protein
MHDLSTLSGRPTPMVVGGKTYLLHDLAFSDLDELQAWIDTRFRDPQEMTSEHLLGTGARLPVEIKKFMVREAMEMARKPKPQLGMKEATAQMLSVEGLKKILLISIRKGDPTFSDEDAAELFRTITFDQTAEIVERTGILSLKGDGDEADGPKVQAPAMTAGA